MRTKLIAAALGVLLLGGVCRAEDDTDQLAWHVVPKQMFAYGSRNYEASDTSLILELPYGFSVNGAANLFDSDISSQTVTYTVGVGASWDRFALNGSYATTTMSNYESAKSIDVGGSMYTTSKDFRTTFSADVDSWYLADYIFFPRFGARVDTTALTPTASLKQKFWNTHASVEVSDTQYNENIATRSDKVSRYPRLFGPYAGLSGLINGFPSYSEKLGLSQDFEAVPLSLWGTYQGIHLNTIPGGGGTVDNYRFGVDGRLPKNVLVTFSYQRIRQTDLGPTNLYNLSATVKF
jgi:hypothetical protein